MGVVISKCYTMHEERRELRARIHVLEEDIKQLNLARSRDHEQLVASNEECNQERKKHEEEAARLRKRLEEEENVVRRLKGEAAAASRGSSRRMLGGHECLVEQMKEEQARRELAVDKWKQLYLAIKIELDNLIHRTRQGERFCWGAEEGMIEGLRGELKDKEGIIEVLRSHITVMETEGIKREREIDIMRQSLRILNGTKRNRTRKNIAARNIQC